MESEDDTNRAYNSSDDEKEKSANHPISWYQCWIKSYSMRIWDSIFALVVLSTCIWNPLAIVFDDSFHLKEDSDINWVVLDSFNNGLWALAFFINLNRVDFVRKIETFGESSKAYLKSFLVPDALCLIVSIVAIANDEPILAKQFELIRIFHFKEALFPVYLFVQKISQSGPKRIS